MRQTGSAFILIIDSACARMKMPYQYRFSTLLTAIFYLYWCIDNIT